MSQLSNQLSEQEKIDLDLDMFEMEREWERTRPRHTEDGWLQIFPEAKKRYGKYIISKLKIFKKYLENERQTINQRAREQLLQNTGRDNAWRDDLIKEGARTALRRVEKSIRSTEAQIEVARQIGNKRYTERREKITITPQMVERAKEYPIERLVEINRAGFTRCFAHNDKKPSAYCRKNFVHCFVCQKSWDTIAVLVERDGIKFREAVLQLQ